MFPPNETCNGGTSWWLQSDPEPVLIDCPPLTKDIVQFLRKLSSNSLPRIILTNREAHGRVTELHSQLGWPVLVQDQEAYLLPGIKKLETFSESYQTVAGLRLLWTPGPTPGSCVVLAPSPWNVLFCGRLLIPTKLDQLKPFRTRTTFHWTRYQKSLQKLRQWIPWEQRPLLASGVSNSNNQGGVLFEWDSWVEPWILFILSKFVGIKHCATASFGCRTGILSIRLARSRNLRSNHHLIFRIILSATSPLSNEQSRSC